MPFEVVTGRAFFKPLRRFLKELSADTVGDLAKIQTRHGDLVHWKVWGGALNFASSSDAHVNRELFVRNTDALSKSPSQVQKFLYAAGPHDAILFAQLLAALNSGRGILGHEITMEEADTQIAFSMAPSDWYNAESAHIFARPHWMLAPWRRELTRRKHKAFPIAKAAIVAQRHNTEPNDGPMNQDINGGFDA